MYIKKYNSLFIHIPRTGGTSVERTFGYQGGFDTYDESRGMNQDHRSAKEVYPLLQEQWDDIFKFTIVRNPWEKMVSMYLYKLNSPFYASQSNEWENRFKRETGEFPSFNRWLINMEWATNRVRVMGCFDQLNYITIDGKVCVDFIAEFSTLSKDWGKIREQMQCIEDLPHLNKSKKSYDYRSFYDSETDKTIRQRFAKDIEYFGYEL